MAPARLFLIAAGGHMFPAQVLAEAMVAISTDARGAR